MTASPSLTEEELNCLKETAFFVRKRKVSAYVEQQLALLNNEIDELKVRYAHLLPEELCSRAGKISKGENYRGFPWVVLDNPRVFNKEHVIAFRSLVWWGHEISFTLHLGGIYIKALQENPAALNAFCGGEYYFNINTTPWEYHFGEDNYRLLEKVPDLTGRDFIKISVRKSIDEIHLLPQQGSEIFRNILPLLLQATE